MKTEQPLPQAGADRPSEPVDTTSAPRFDDVLNETYGPKALSDSMARNSSTANSTTGGESQFLDMSNGEITSGVGTAAGVESIGTGGGAGTAAGVESGVTGTGADGAAAKPPNTAETSKMLDWMGQHFKEMDMDGDGRLTKKEIGQAVLDPKLGNGDGAKYLASAYIRADEFGSAAQSFGAKPEPAKTVGTADGGADKDSATDAGKDSATDAGKDSGTDSDNDASKKGEEKEKEPSFTQSDLKTLRDNVSRLDGKESQDKLSVDRILDFWKQVDINNDETLTRDELTKSLERKDWSAEQRKGLELLEKNFSDVAKASDDFIPIQFSGQSAYPPRTLMPSGTQTDEIQSWDRPLKIPEGTPEYVSTKDIKSYAHQGDKFLSGLDRTRTARDAHMAEDAQGITGSCFAMSPAQELMSRNPEAVNKMIKDNGDGTSTVTFPGDKDNPVKVTNPTAAERALYASGEKSAIIEKAFAQRSVDKVGSHDTYNGKDGGPKVPIQEALQPGGRADHAMLLLTGAESVDSVWSPDASDAQLKEQLSQANDKGKLLVAASLENTPNGSGIVQQHGYSVTGFDAKTGKVELRNPYAGSSAARFNEPTNVAGVPLDGKNDGRFKMDLADFKKNFGWVHSAEIAQPKN